MISESKSVKKLKNNNLEIILHLKISRAWKGYGSALFLELGELHDELAWKKDNELTTTSVGEFTLSSAGSWKLFKRSKNILDADNATSTEIKKVMKDLESQTIESIEINGKLTVNLSNNITLEFNSAEHGFFTLVSNVKPFISYEDNSLYAHHSII
jgi:hypothetical protein